MFDTISKQTGLKKEQVAAVAGLMEQGATIPFIARYRKEHTGSLDEVSITTIRDALAHLKALQDRKETILNSLDTRELLTPQLQEAIKTAATPAELEDLYQPYRPKKRTRALMAKEKGLMPLAEFILSFQKGDPMERAEQFVDGEKGITSPEDALAGARDIVAETINETPALRTAMRHLFLNQAQMTTRVKKNRETDGVKYRDYFEWSEPGSKAPSHRILAMLRGEKEGILTLHALPPEEKAMDLLEKRFLNPAVQSAPHMAMAISDSYKRLLGKAMENETLKTLKERADTVAIKVFAENLKNLLLSSPLGQKAVLAIDPGFRTGCKMVCLDRQGNLVDHMVIFPLGSGAAKAGQAIRKWITTHDIEAIAIGNGTAGRETETFVNALNLSKKIPVILVDESGASIYSASPIAREEFPDHDLTVRGAVSIGRRLMDPLAELVKLDPRSIGVGQYQHDVDQKELNQCLDDVVINTVNQVGVDVNTASKELLSRVAGLNKTIAANIVQYRLENGPFKTRRELLKVPRLGPRAFEQAAGFLRIPRGTNPLDASGIHPESYKIVQTMARDLGVSVKELVGNDALVASIDLKKYLTPDMGMPTLKDIAKELVRPGRDPRQQFIPFAFAEDIHEIKDLVPGMVVPGIITNVTAFGAFVDIGVHQDGLVHVSNMADHFVKNPSDIVSVHQKVRVTIMEVDIPRKRIALSLKTRAMGS
ncbi:Tex family protein [Desulfocicer niacini]